MGVLQKPPYLKDRGLTLIEVLVALAIVAIALTAIIKAASQNIRSTAYLQTKTIAMWVAQNKLNEVRTGLVLLNNPPLSAVSNTLGRKWYAEIDVKETPNKQIKKVIIHVSDHEEKTEDEAPLVSLEGYIYNQAGGE